MTEYRVLTRNADQRSWTEFENPKTDGGFYEADSQYQAKAQAARDLSPGPGERIEFVAVPRRSWEPQRVRQEMQARFVWDEDDGAPADPEAS